ncbi:MAG: RNA polymerase sigma factor [Phycisphaerales bacterium]|nr:RNA polymerase sigma factor [Phycisphaerales bacterium]
MGISVERAGIVLQLFDDFYDRVYCFTRRLLPPDQAEDVVQEVFVRLLESRNLETITVNVSYLIKAADNLIKRRYGRTQRRLRILEETRRERASSSDPGSTSPGAERLGEAELERRMGQLTRDEQEAIRLIVCEGLSYEHAARSMGVPTTTVNNWKYRGLQKLQHNLAESADGPD